MLGKPLADITEADIEALIAAKTPESRTLDYKRELPSRNDSGKMDFLTDIASMANASGGYLIYGIEEERDSDGKSTGLPESILGMGQVNVDDQKLWLENLLRDCIMPKIVGIQMVEVSMSDGRKVFLVYAPKSILSPHMVRIGKNQRFYVRTNSGNREMDWQEIRSSFLLSEELGERIRMFRRERLALILNGETPVTLVDGAKIVLHLAPLWSFSPGSAVDLALAKDNFGWLSPIDADASQRRFNFDGFLTWGHGYGLSRGEHATSYVQLFRNGCIESVAGKMIREDEDWGRTIPSVRFEEDLMKTIGRYFELFRKLEATPPVLCFLTLLNVKGYEMVTNVRYEVPRWRSIERDSLLLPEVIVEEYSQTVATVLRPVFDAVWNACGYAGSLNYDENGNWRVHPPR